MQVAPRCLLLVLAAALAASCGGGSGSDTTAPPAGSDTQAPTLAWTAPADLSDALSGSVTLAVDAGDDVGVAGVEFQLDGIALGAEVTQPPYRAVLDSAAHASGQHVLRARARDAAGNRSPWRSITVRLAGGRAVEAGFAMNEAWIAGLSNATAFAQAPDGRLFVAQQGGAVRVVKNGALLPAPFHSVTVDSAGERGLIGIALHPDFAHNGWVYVHYTSPQGGSHGRISRLVAQGDVSDGTEQVLVDLPPLSSAANHNGGALHFGPDGKLYAGVGDNANGAQAQDLSLPFGKLLRFNDDGSVPGDNPSAATQAGLGRAVWAYGLRNPFTFAFEPGTGRLHINDVGQNTWEEIDVGQAGANHGWPSSEGPEDLSGAMTAPLFSYRHSETTPPGSGPGGFFTGFCIAGGAFYPASDGSFPAALGGSYFFADFVSRWVGRLDLRGDGSASAFATLAGSPVDLLVGTDGALYVLTRGAIARIAPG